MSHQLDQVLVPITLFSRNGKLIWHNDQALSLLPESLFNGDLLSKELCDNAWALISTTNTPSINPRLVSFTNTDLQLVLSGYVLNSHTNSEDLLLLVWHPKDCLQELNYHILKDLADIAHDLKNPLGALFGYADTLLDTELSKGIEEKQKGVIDRIRATAARAISLVKNYELLFLLDNKLAPPPTGKADLNKIIKVVLDYSTRNYKSAPKVVLDLEEKLPPIKIDRASLERLVSNLINNALKYTPTSEKIQINTQCESKQIILSVTNTGVFIDEQEKDSIFKQCVRGSNSKGTAGTGLGLYIVNKICNYFNADLTLESNKELGTKFTVVFPTM